MLRRTDPYRVSSLHGCTVWKFLYSLLIRKRTTRCCQPWDSFIR